MKQIETNNAMILVLERGEELHKQLGDFAKKHGLKGAWLSGLGGASKVTLGFYSIETKTYQWHEYSEPLEIVSLTGNLAYVDGEPFWHVHGSFSDQTYNTVGGHVKELVVGLTGELCITPLDAPLARVYDETTGLKLIN